MSGNSFRFQTNSTDDQRSINTFPISSIGDVKEAAVAHRADRDVHENVKEDLEGAEVDNAMNIQVEAENVVEAFEGTTVGKVFRNVGPALSTLCKENWLDMGKIKDVQVKIPKLRMGEKLSVHAKEKIIACDFSNKNHLNRHNKVVHKKVKQDQCSQCLKKFSAKNSLKKHIKVVHNNEKPHACPQPDCEQKFGQKLDLKRHMMKFHNFEKPYACIAQNCGKKFVTCSELKDHLRSAHGAAKLLCGFENCASTFTHQCKLSVHKKEHHSDK